MAHDTVDGEGFHVPGLVPDVATTIVEMATHDSLHAWAIISIVSRQWSACANRVLSATPRIKKLKETNAVSMPTMPRRIVLYAQYSDARDGDAMVAREEAFRARCRSIVQHLKLPELQYATTEDDWTGPMYERGLQTLVTKWNHDEDPQGDWIWKYRNDHSPLVIGITETTMAYYWFRGQWLGSTNSTKIGVSAIAIPWPDLNVLHPPATNVDWNRTRSIVREVQEWTERPILIIFARHNDQEHVHWMFAYVDGATKRK